MRTLTPNPTLANKLSEELLPSFIRIINLEHAHKLLVYMLRRPDVDFEAPTIEPILRHVRQVDPQFINTFYQIFQPLNAAILQYIRLEESCTMSGQYRKDMDLARAKVKAIVEKYEQEPEQPTLQIARNVLVIPSS